MSINFSSLLIAFVMFIIPMLFAITFHEAAHGYIAKIRGDNTAYLMGRVSLNPLKHIDPLGTIILPSLMFLIGTGFLFGWAKPVPVNFNQLRNPKWDSILVAIAGPLANFMMAIIWFGLWKYIPNSGFNQMAYFGVVLNLMLMVFNLIPIPPLDGSRVISAFLPNQTAIRYNRLERWGFLIILALLFIPFGNTNILAGTLFPMVYDLFSFIQWLF